MVNESGQVTGRSSQWGKRGRKGTALASLVTEVLRQGVGKKQAPTGPQVVLTGPQDPDNGGTRDFDLRHIGQAGQEAGRQACRH